MYTILDKTLKRSYFWSFPHGDMDRGHLCKRGVKACLFLNHLSLITVRDLPRSKERGYLLLRFLDYLLLFVFAATQTWANPIKKFKPSAGVK